MRIRVATSHARVIQAWMSTLRACALALAFALAIAAPAAAQTCSFNANQPGSVSFGTIDPTLTTPATFSVTVNYKCAGAANATFTIIGLNDSGPGAYRLKQLTQLEYMPYSISTINTSGSKITLNGQINATDYQNASAGAYADTLTITILP